MLRGAPTQARPAALTLVGAALALLLLAGPARADGDRIQEGHWNKRDVPKGWSVAETEHFQVQSEIGEDLALRLGQHLERMLKLYEDFLPTRRKLETFVLKVFKDKKGFCDYSGFKLDTGTVAYYNQSGKELVGYDCGFVFGERTIPPALKLKPSTGTELSGKDIERIVDLLDDTTDTYTFDLVRVLSHEGWHQYFHFFTVSWVSMPSWLDEGLGDYFFMATDDASAGEHGLRIGDMNWHRLRRLRRALEDGETATFEALMDFEQQDYYSNPGVYYAQGWSMVQFLMQHPDPEYRELIPKLIKDFKDSKNFKKSTDKVFRKHDLASVEHEWIGWLLQQPIEDPLLTLAREYGARVKPEDLEGEARLVDVYKWYLKHPGYPGSPGAAAAPPPAPPAEPPRLEPPKKDG